MISILGGGSRGDERFNTFGVWVLFYRYGYPSRSNVCRYSMLT